MHLPMPEPRRAITGSVGRSRMRAVLLAGVVAGAAVAGCGGSDDAAPPVSDGASPSAPVVTDGPLTSDPPETTESAPESTAADTTATDAPASTEPVARTYDFSAIGPVVDEFVAEHDLEGAGLVIVERDDGIVHEEYWGAFDADRVSLIASASKMVVAGVLLRLDDQGLLDMDAPISDVADWGAGNPEITPAQLVSNSSGLVGLFPEPVYLPYVCQFLFEAALQDCGATIFTTPDDDADVVAPDTEFRYGGGQWQVAGAVAEVASGKSWQQLLEETYIEPCGVDSLGFNNHFTQLGTVGFGYPEAFAGDPSTLQPTANPNMEGGAYVDPPDYGALLLMHLRDGWCGDTRVLSTAALEAAHGDRTGDVYGSRTAYGMGWWVDEVSGRITDPGAYGAVPWLDLAEGYGGYLVLEADGDLGGELAERLYPIVDSAVLIARD